MKPHHPTLCKVENNTLIDHTDIKYLPCSTVLVADLQLTTHSAPSINHTMTLTQMMMKNDKGEKQKKNNYHRDTLSGIYSSFNDRHKHTYIGARSLHSVLHGPQT